MRVPQLEVASKDKTVLLNPSLIVSTIYRVSRKNAPPPQRVTTLILMRMLMQNQFHLSNYSSYGARHWVVLFIFSRPKVQCSLT